MAITPAPATPAKTPKRRNTTQAPPAVAIHSTKTRDRKMALDDLGRMASLFFVMKGQYADAGAIAQHGDNVTQEIALLGENNETVSKFLDYLTQTGPFFGILTAGMPLLLQLAANHNKIDASKLPPETGVVSPAVLEERVKADMELAQASMMAEIAKIRQQTANAQRELEIALKETSE